jgi:prevent-host-death family protein
MEHTVNTARLKATLSSVLASVKAGEEIVVTERGRPIASIRRYEGSDSGLDSLVREGRLRRAAGKLDQSFWKMPRPRDPRGRSLAALLAEREEGR